MKILLKLITGFLYFCVGITLAGVIILVFMLITAVNNVVSLPPMLDIILYVGATVILIIFSSSIIFEVGLLYEYLNDKLWTYQRKLELQPKSPKKVKAEEAVKTEEAL